MRKFWEEPWADEAVILIVFAAIVVAIMAASFIGPRVDQYRHKQVISECMSHGYTQHECDDYEAMVKARQR